MKTQFTTIDDVRRRLREITTPARPWEKPTSPHVSADIIAEDCRIHRATLFRFMAGKGLYSKTVDTLIWWINRYDQEQADNREYARSSHGAAGE